MMEHTEHMDAIAHYDKMIATVPPQQLVPCPTDGDTRYMARLNGTVISLPVFGHPDQSQLYMVLPPVYAIAGFLEVLTITGSGNDWRIAARHLVTEQGLESLHV